MQAEWPVLRMCPVPDCGGWERCGLIDKSGPVTIAAREEADPVPGISDEDAFRHLAGSLASGGVTDGKGCDRALPGGLEFTVHKGTAWHHGKQRVTWDAVYSGSVPAAEVIDSAPAWNGLPLQPQWDGPRW